jgi:hypothetical protein
VRFRTGRIAATVVGTAVVLVLGTDFATFATTGNSLILGHFNSATTTTTLTNKSGGPALRLRSSGGKSPALKINNSKKIRNLNADAVDGRTATQLASHAITFTAGQRGDRIQGAQIWNVPVAAGTYQVSFKAVVIPHRGTVQAPVQVVCGVADLLTLGSRTHVYTADSATYIGDFPAIMSGAEVVRITPGQKPGLLCTTAANTAGVRFRLFAPVTASFIKVNSREVRTAAPMPMQRGNSRLLSR